MVVYETRASGYNRVGKVHTIVFRPSGGVLIDLLLTYLYESAFLLPEKEMLSQLLNVD